MPSLALAIALASLAAPTQEAPRAETVRFSKRAPKVGDVCHAELDLGLDLDLAIVVDEELARSIPWDISEIRSTRFEVLECREGRVTKLEVQFVKHYSTRPGPEEPVVRELPLVGKTVLVEKTEDGYEVTDEEGRAVEDEATLSAAEGLWRKRLSDDAQSELDYLTAEPLTIGQVVELKGAAALEAAGLPEVGGPDEVVLKHTLIGTRDSDGVELAVFDVELTLLGMDGSGLRASATLTGSLCIGTSDSRRRALVLEGDVTLQGRRADGDRQVRYQGTGPVKGRGSWTYRYATR